jgi:hypothetical protein
MPVVFKVKRRWMEVTGCCYGFYPLFVFFVVEAGTFVISWSLALIGIQECIAHESIREGDLVRIVGSAVGLEKKGAILKTQRMALSARECNCLSGGSIGGCRGQEA